MRRRSRQSQNQNRNASARSKQQLQQLELRQRQDRYETERRAQAQQQNPQREDLQALNRLRELARRQNEMSEKLKELEAALRQAETEEQSNAEDAQCRDQTFQRSCRGNLFRGNGCRPHYLILEVFVHKNEGEFRKTA